MESRVTNESHVVQNIMTLRSALKAGNAQALELVRKGRNFVSVRLQDGMWFAPSRFAGYANNSIDEHRDTPGHGGRTTARLDALLPGSRSKDDVLEAEFLRFCTRHHIEPIQFERTYWPTLRVLLSRRRSRLRMASSSGPSSHERRPSRSRVHTLARHRLVHQSLVQRSVTNGWEVDRIAASASIIPDLAVRHPSGSRKILFEIKSWPDAGCVYEGVGQLLVYRCAIGDSKQVPSMVLVIPRSTRLVPPGLWSRALRMNNVCLLRWHTDRRERVVFSTNLDAILERST